VTDDALVAADLVRERAALREELQREARQPTLLKESRAGATRAR
jgi:hypothetical protein